MAPWLHGLEACNTRSTAACFAFVRMRANMPLFTSFFCIPLYPELRHGLSFHILIASASAFCQLMRNRQLTWKLKLAGVTTTTATSQFRLRLQEDTGPKIEPLRVRDVVCVNNVSSASCTTMCHHVSIVWSCTSH